MQHLPSGWAAAPGQTHLPITSPAGLVEAVVGRSAAFSQVWEAAGIRQQARAAAISAAAAALGRVMPLSAACWWKDNRSSYCIDESIGRVQHAFASSTNRLRCPCNVMMAASRVATLVTYFDAFYRALGGLKRGPIIQGSAENANRQPSAVPTCFYRQARPLLAIRAASLMIKKTQIYAHIMMHT